MSVLITLTAPAPLNPSQTVILSHAFTHAFQLRSLHAPSHVGETCALQSIVWKSDEAAQDLPFVLVNPLPLYFFQTPGFELRLSCAPTGEGLFSIVNQSSEIVTPSLTLVGDNVDEIYQSQIASKQETLDIKRF